MMNFLDMSRIVFAFAIAVLSSHVMVKEIGMGPITNGQENMTSVNITTVNLTIISSNCSSMDVTKDYDEEYLLLFLAAVVGIFVSLIQILSETRIRGQRILDILVYSLAILSVHDSELNEEMQLETSFHYNDSSQSLLATNQSCQLASHCVVMADWQWSVGTLCLVMSWVNLIHKMRDISYIGVIVTMVYEVMMTFTKVSIIIAPFLVSYGLTFHIFLRGPLDSPFRVANSSILKTFVMFIGELDYAKFNKAVYDSNLNKTNHGLIIAYFIIFLIMMPLIFMNLLLGMAVGDIENIRKRAGIKDLRDKAICTLRTLHRIPIWLQHKLYRWYKDAKLGQDCFIRVSISFFDILTLQTSD